MKALEAAKPRFTSAFEWEGSTAGSIGRDFVTVFDLAARRVLAPRASAAGQIELAPLEAHALLWLAARARSTAHVPGPCLMGEFARGLGIPVSTATHLVNRLVEQGVVARERSEQDRRVVQVELTAAGQERNDRLLHQRLQGSLKLLDKLSIAEQRSLVALLRKATA